MLTLASSLLSFLMSGLPSFIKLFQDRADKQHELKLAQMQTEREMQMLAAGYAAQQKIEEIKLDEIKTQTEAETKMTVIDAQKEEMKALYNHDIEIGKGASQWVTDIRAATRSLLTLGFYLLLVLIDIGIFIHGMSHDAPFTELADELWDEDTRIMFAAIITFHFGGRAFGK